MNPLKLPPQEILDDFLRYDKDAGRLFWRLSDRRHFATDRRWNWWNQKYAGKRVKLNPSSSGHMRLRFRSIQYQAHRIIWKLVHGYDPIEIDHINHNPADNRLANLREVTRSENLKNSSLHKNSTTGVCGVHERDGLYQARIHANGARIHLGYFRTLEEAAEARKQAEQENGFHRNHGRPPVRQTIGD